MSPLLKTVLIPVGCGSLAFAATLVRNRTSSARPGLSALQAGALAAVGALVGVLAAQWWGD